ncbi:hypothetical protein H4219_004572 [Mycoemilia scoparia]|uniref:Endoglucanase n=1 Tax=Mycoemilia scoparia TaxID=417184 RepID=A0A9W8DR48_9FUNG|nr:hypothetical protein H4219_004572 [Mycoemilia scoparia]
MKSTFTTTLAITLTFLAPSLLGHMLMLDPCPRYYDKENCPKPPSGQKVDYEINGSIGDDEKIKRPKCHYTVPYDEPTVKMTAGGKYTVKFSKDGPNGHKGGHCQFAIGYNGEDFVAIHEVFSHCFYKDKGADADKYEDEGAEVFEYEVPIPKDVPSGRAIFAWGWTSAYGTREFYMNCSDIEIEGGTGTELKGKSMIYPNYGPDPEIAIPELADAGYEVGIEYYKNAKEITVKPEGGSTGGGSSEPGSKKSKEEVADNETSTTPDDEDEESDGGSDK